MNIDEVKAAAKKELEDEAFKAAVQKMKEKLRNAKSWRTKLWPWRIIVVKRIDLDSLE